MNNADSIRLNSSPPPPSLWPVLTRLSRTVQDRSQTAIREKGHSFNEAKKVEEGKENEEMETEKIREPESDEKREERTTIIAYLEGIGDYFHSFASIHSFSPFIHVLCLSLWKVLLCKKWNHFSSFSLHSLTMFMCLFQVIITTCTLILAAFLSLSLHVLGSKTKRRGGM